MKVYSTSVDVNELAETATRIMDDFGEKMFKQVRRLLINALITVVLSVVLAIVSGVFIMCWLDTYMSVIPLIVLVFICVVVVFNAVKVLSARILKPLVNQEIDMSLTDTASEVLDVLRALEFVSEGQLKGVRYYEGSNNVLIEIQMPGLRQEKVCSLPKDMIAKCKDEDVLDFSWLDEKAKELESYGDKIFKEHC